LAFWAICLGIRSQDRLTEDSLDLPDFENQADLNTRESIIY